MQRTYSFENVQVDPAQRSLRIDGKPAPLGGRAFDLLLALLERTGALASKDDLLTAVWGPVIVEEAKLHVQVSALRKLLGAHAIETVPGRGYRFLPRVAGAAEAPAPDAPAAPAPDTPPGNLSLVPPTLHGRDDELAALRSALQSHRLVTLLGIGGVGKTSLALAAAHAERAQWPAGAWFVDMAPVRDPAHVVDAVAHALGVSLGDQRDPVEELVLALAARQMLVVIDNAEHLWERITAVAAALLEGTASLRLLITSRQELRLPQEQRFALAGLSAPANPDLSDARQLGALTLFAARVAALSPRFRLTADNAPAVAEIAVASTACRWPSSWPRRGCPCSDWRSCVAACIKASACWAARPRSPRRAAPPDAARHVRLDARPPVAR